MIIMNRIQPIKVFGENAKEIREGEIFEASVGSVEGRTVVTLNNLGLFEGKTFVHIGKKNTIGDLADAILETSTTSQAKGLIHIMQIKMTEPKFLKQEADFNKLVAKIKKEKELKH